MRDKIDQLESANIVPGQLFGNNLDLDAGGADPESAQKLEKVSRKLKAKETEIKQQKSELLDKKNQLSKAELKIVKLEAAVREA